MRRKIIYSRWLLVPAAAVALTAAGIRALPAADARVVLEACKVYDRVPTAGEGGDPNTAFDAGRCQGFVEGFSGGYERGVFEGMLRKEGGRYRGESRWGFCPPPGTTLGQAVHVFVKYAERNRDMLDDQASLVMVRALAAEYPCGE